MTTTSTSRRRRNLLRLTARATAIGAFGLAAASMTLANAASAAAVTTVSAPELNAATPATSPPGFIMGDGRICNPRWGC